MKIIKEKIKINQDIENLIPENSIFLDIETTGLNRNFSRIYLIGLLGKKDGDYYLYQFLTESKEDEKDLIIESGEIINQFEEIITFNGNSFDLNFIKIRGNILNVNTNFLNKKSTDLYIMVRDEGGFLELENRRLKTIEKYLGIFREDKYSGKELINKYYEFENGKLENENLLLLHNKEDIINMPYLFQLLKIFEEENMIKLNNFSFLVKKISIKYNSLYIEGNSDIKTGYFDDGKSGILEIKNNNFKFTRSLEKGNYSETIKCQYIDYADKALESNYNIKTPDGIYLLKYDNIILYKNIKELFVYQLNRFFQ